MDAKVSFTLNGKNVSADTSSATLLVELLRNHFGLTGAHRGL